MDIFLHKLGLGVEILELASEILHRRDAAPAASQPRPSAASRPVRSIQGQEARFLRHVLKSDGAFEAVNDAEASGVKGLESCHIKVHVGGEDLLGKDPIDKVLEGVVCLEVLRHALKAAGVTSLKSGVVVCTKRKRKQKQHREIDIDVSFFPFCR